MKWFFVVLYTSVGLLLFGKGIELWLTLLHSNSELLDVSFIGVVLISDARRAGIQNYALGFTVAAFIPILMAVKTIFKQKLINR